MMHFVVKDSVVVVVRGLSMPGRCVGCRHLRILIRESCHYVLQGMEILFLLPRHSSQGQTGTVRGCSGLTNNLFRVIFETF